MEEQLVLYLYFLDTEGKRRTVKIYDPKEDLTAMNIKSSMDTIQTNDIFEWKIASLDGAKLVKKTVTDMDI